MAGFQNMMFNIGPAVVAPGQVQFTTAGTYSWTAPAGVTSASVVAVGGGGGPDRNTGRVGSGQGGGLGWKNNITVVPGSSYTVEVGAGGIRPANTTVIGYNGGNSYFISLATVAGIGGLGKSNTLANSGSFVGDGGGIGGGGATTIRGSGGGAGGYAGNGAAGVAGPGTPGIAGPAAPPGGGAGAGGSGPGGAGGGGVGILGQGPSGGASPAATTDNGGRGGSGGTNGGPSGTNIGTGGTHGGGGGTLGTAGAQSGGTGAVRIIWGTGRAFPSTGTGNL